MNTHSTVLFVFFLSALAFGQQREPEYVYVSNGGVSGFAVNTATGSLTAVPTFNFPVSGPLAVAPTGRFVFVPQR